MVFAVTGKLGGGKSLTCVHLMLENLRRGNFVTSNIKLKDEYLKKWEIDASRYTYIEDFATVDPWTLRSGDFRGSGGNCRSMIVIDEAGEWLDSYSDARHKGQLADVASWLRQSDKLGQDVYFIVQFENLLHNRLRSIVHFWIVCKDCAKIRLPLLPFSLPFISHFVCASYFDGRSKEMSNRIWILKSPLLYNAYDTAAFFGNSYLSSATSSTLELTGANYRRDFVSFRKSLFVVVTLVALEVVSCFSVYLWLKRTTCGGSKILAREAECRADCAPGGAERGNAR